MTKKSWLPNFLILAFVWGFSFLFIKVSLEALTPPQVAFYRIGLGALTLGLIIAVQRKGLQASRAVIGHSVLAGLVSNAIPFTLIAWAEQRIPSAVAGILNATTPLFTLIFAAAVLADERFQKAQAAGLTFSFLGVVVVLAPWNGMGGSVIGASASVLAAVCYGASSVYIRRNISGKIPIVEQAFWQLLFGAIWLLPLQRSIPTDVPWKVVGSIAAIGILGSAVANVLMNHLYLTAGAIVASSVTYLIPVVSTIAGIAILGERLTTLELVGAVMVITGLVASGRRSSVTKKSG